MKINRDIDIAVFEALFVTVKEILFEPYDCTFIKSADIYMVLAL